MGRRLADLSHQQMGLNADLSSRMTERFQRRRCVVGQVVRAARHRGRGYAARAAGVRDIGVRIAINRAVFFVALTTVASLATAMVYGFGGIQAIEGVLTVGTLFALTALLARLYGPSPRSPMCASTS